MTKPDKMQKERKHRS